MLYKRLFSTKVNYRNVRKKYLRHRLNKLNMKFSRSDVKVIEKAFECTKIDFNRKHTILNSGVMPAAPFDSKPISDNAAILLWNEMFPKEYNVNQISDIKFQANRYIEWCDINYPNGDNATEELMILYGTAHSHSSFYGIQKPSKSNFSLKSMIKTLEGHSNPRVVDKPWLLDNLRFIDPYLRDNPSIMNRSYADVCLHAKVSSASIPGVRSYRDFVLEHTFDQVIDMVKDSIDYVIYAGTRIDKRGKYRLICSFVAMIRIIDFYINNGSYGICENDGILSSYTTEGYDNKMMWPELRRMCERGLLTMICLDYSGYDTQISLKEYLALSKFLNKYRLNDDEFKTIFSIFETWLRQPKPLGIRKSGEFEMLMPYYSTLASGLHGTHSFENLIGISTCRHLESIGVRVKDFWTNGDDQNLLVYESDVDKTIEELEKYFVINWKKSLVGHKLSVWGKLWFSNDIHPFWEIGTFRSIWEKEKGDVDFVEESKFESNYCKIIQVLIILIRLNKHSSVINWWAEFLCKQVDPVIDHERLPIKLQNMSLVKKRSTKRSRKPYGLQSVKSELMSSAVRFRMFGAHNMYEMLENMYLNDTKYTLDISQIKYHSKGTELTMRTGKDYSSEEMKDIPYMFSKLLKKRDYSNEEMFIRSIFSSTNSYEGPVNRDYKFVDMVSLAYSLNDRNKYIWRNIHY